MALYFGYTLHFWNPEKINAPPPSSPEKLGGKHVLNLNCFFFGGGWGPSTFIWPPKTPDKTEMLEG